MKAKLVRLIDCVRTIRDKVEKIGGNVVESRNKGEVKLYLHNVTPAFGATLTDEMMKASDSSCLDVRYRYNEFGKIIIVTRVNDL